MLYKVFALSLIVLLTGCASSPMVTSPQQSIQNPAEDKAQVVFLRSSFLGSAINGSLYDVTDGDIKFIGVIANGTKVLYETTPGKHMFMVVSEAADFMSADLSEGKNYFSLVTPRMGAWKARFSLWPIKNDSNAEFNFDSKDFQKWLSSTEVVENSDQSKAWYEANKESVKQKYQDYWPVWQEKTHEQMLKRSLLSDDGM